MNRRFQFAVVASSTCLVLMLLFGAVRGRSASNDNNVYSHLGVYSEVLSRIKADYVEEPDMKAVTVGAINGMLESLDPYASYLNAEQYKQYQKTKDQTRASVGVVLSRRFGYLSVVDALPGSAAAKAGISTGDVIESIGNVSTRDMPLALAQMLLDGDNGSTVELSVLRVRKSEPQKMTLTRANLVYPPVSGRLVNEPGKDPIGIISTYALDPGRAKDIAAKVEDLEKQGAKRLILDLRHCSTGSLEEGIAVANLFLDKGLITYSQGQKVSRQDYQANTSKAITKLPLAVVVNRGTAGASEIVASALMGRRADVVGEHTYGGDATIRQGKTMDDGSAVLIAVAKYYSPDAKAIEDTGVTPNVAVADTEQIGDLDDDNADAAVPATPKGGPDVILKQAIETVSKK
ncbi:MAG: PDZ domain-containing protein [Acidobacteriia bacterium]|nr:PDZ domain-containing protein [Terriglobia bacterium]